MRASRLISTAMYSAAAAFLVRGRLPEGVETDMDAFCKDVSLQTSYSCM